MVHLAKVGSIQHEMAITLNDWMIRRTHIMHEDAEQGLDCAPEVAAMMAPYLGWDAAQVERQVQEYHEQVRLSQHHRTPVTPDLEDESM